MDERTKGEREERCRRIRQHIVRMTHAAGSGHPGGSLSQVEILVSLYFGRMRHRPDDPSWEGRDRLVLSKGHGCPALYAAMAEAGYLEVDDLLTLRKLDSILQGHPDRRKLPILEASTGSLGMGLSIAIGLAVGLNRQGSDSRVFCILGDGEMDEGQVWEAALFAAPHGIDNLIAIGDMNGIQNDDFVEKVLPLGDVAAKWRAFGWHTIEVDGHDLEALDRAFEEAISVEGKPKMILAQTVKGKGVSFMEHNPKFHGTAPSDEELELALTEIG